MTRREFAAALVAVGVAPAIASACAPAPSPIGPPPGSPASGPFPDGVMAGDPLPDGTVIWTRLTRPSDGGDRTVTWMVADDAAMSVIRTGGTAVATAGADHCVKVRVDGLDPNRWYWYRFNTPDGSSQVGRLRTAPTPGTTVDSMRFAFGSCQQINSESWFVAHRRLAEEGLDFFIHLGDYVYVNDVATVSLEQYRAKYRQWRTQPDLRDFHAAVPMLSMWDDGEFVNGVDSTMPEPRFGNAKRAWYDHMPLLDSGNQHPERTVGWGALADVFMIDVRTRRDPPVLSQAWEPTRTTLGAAQYSSFTQGLAASDAAWKLVGNPYNLNVWKLIDLEWLRGLNPDLPPDAGVYAPNEAWDNYARERRDLMQFLLDNDVSDVAFCSAHTHIAMAADVRPGPGLPVAATDVVAGSLTADPDVRKSYFPEAPIPVAEAVIGIGEDWIVGQSPDMRYLNLMDQGWVTVDVNPEELVFSIRRVDTAYQDATPTTIAAYRVVRGRPGLELVASSDRGAFS